MNLKQFEEIIKSIFFMGVLFFVIVIFLYFLTNVTKDRREKENKERIEAKKRWFKGFENRGILNFSLVLDDIYKRNPISHGSGWRRVSKVYVNNHRIDMDSLYDKDEFIIKNCDNNYYYFCGNDIDSVNYILSRKKIKHYIKKRLYSINQIIMRKSLNIKYRDHLPQCWD